MSENKLTNNIPQGIFGAIYPFIYGLFVILILIAILTIIATGIVYFSDISESYLRPIGILISTIALFFGGLAFGKKKQKQGLVGGIILGLIFMLIIAIIIFFTNGDFRLILNKSVYLILASAIGGICGIK